jgi:hypothetical protein
LMSLLLDASMLGARRLTRGKGGKKNVTIFRLIGVRSALHVVYPLDGSAITCCSPRSTGYWPWLFTLIFKLFTTLNRLSSHDSTQTWDSSLIAP